jgi:hypothetical protein
MMGGEDKARGGSIILGVLFSGSVWRIILLWLGGGACCGFVEELVGGLSQGALGLLGFLGSEGQETARVPGARESEEALFLAGWEEKIQFSGSFKQLATTRKKGTTSSSRGILPVLILLSMKVMLCNLFVTILDYII